MSDAAQIIAAHMYDFETWTCMCQLDKPDSMTRPEWAAHVLAVLSERHEVVELPEPDVDGTWRVDDTDIEVRFAGGSPTAIEFRVEALNGRTLAKLYDVTVGPDFAACLIAAARSAEATQ